MDYIESGYSKFLKYNGGLDLSTVDSSLGSSFEGGSATIGSGSSNVLTNPITDSRNPEAVKEGVVPSQWEIGRHAFIIGGANGYNDGTGFFLGWDDTTYKFSIGNASSNYLTWDGTTLSIAGTITIIAGTIAGLTITATALTATSGGNTTIVSSGATAFTAGPTGAPTFTVTQAGALVASSATITGAITANTGYIGGTTGWVISSENIKDVAGVVGMSSTVTAGDDVRFWAGDATPASAEFRVYESGALVATSATITGSITATSGAIGGFDIGADYVRDAANSMGLASTVTGGDDVRFWAGDTFANRAIAEFRVTESGALTATSATITGSITATSGAIGGWTINATSITDVAGVVGLSSVVTGGDDIRIWAGDVTPASAEFRVTEAGALTASSATITGVITANTGYIGGTSGWVISSENIKDVAGIVGLSSTVTVGDDIRIWAGHATPASAPFYVTEAGALVATSATITGAITATSGTFGGFTIAADYIRDAADSFGLASTVTGGDDVRFWAGDTFANRATADFRVTEAGVVTATSITLSTNVVISGLQAGSSMDGQYLAANTVVSAAVNLALRGWTQTSAFSVTDADTVSWGAGTFTASDGTAYAIGAGNTGNMVARTYIYLDIAVSLIAYQISTTATDAVGNGRVLVAIAQNGTGEASFMLLNNNSYNIDGANLVVGTVTTNEIAATTIIGSNINTLSITGKTVLFDTGTVGGWTLGASTLSAVGGGNTVTLSTGATAFLAGPTGAPTVTITAAGVLTATGVTISGALTATSGAIGGFDIGADYVRDVANSFGLASTVSGGDDVRFWAGDTFANRATADFRVTEAGAMTATSGAIAAFTIATTTLSATNLTLTSGAANTANITVGTGATAGGINSANAAGDITFWSGATFANRATAPFNVQADGTVTATDIQISTVNSTIAGASLFNGKTVSNIQIRAEANYAQFDLYYIGRFDDGFTETATNYTITRNPLTSFFQAGAGASIGRIVSGILGRTDDVSIIDWDDVLEWHFNCNVETDASATTDLFVGLYDRTAATPGTNATDTARHIGFFNDDGTVYASNADGTTQNRTNISASWTETEEADLFFVYDVGTDIKFYVNDVLVATHVANLPTASVNRDPVIMFAIQNGGDLGIKNNYNLGVII